MVKDEEKQDEEVLDPHAGLGNKGRFGGMGDNNLLKSVGISIGAALLVFAVVGFAGGWVFVTKADFSKNMANVGVTLDKANADLAKAKADVTNAIQGIPVTVQTQVSTAVTQATSQFNSQISSLSTKVDTATTNAQSSLNQVNSMSSTLTNLSAKENTDATGLNSSISILTNNMTSVSNRISTLETKSYVSGLYVDNVSAVNGQLNLDVKSNKSQYSSFRLTFRVATGDIQSAVNQSLENMSKGVFTAPLTVTAASNLVPEYSYYWDSVNSVWHINQITYITPKTAIPSGTTTKTLTYSMSTAYTVTYDVLIEPILSATVGTGGSSW